MPRRSNDFQKLIHLIYEQLSDDEGKVTESALVREIGSGIEREVDVLIERSIADVTIRIAVECQDRSRSSDVTWIDQLIGKYEHLPINQIIAVAKGGFSEAAATKAQQNKIELRTLSQAMDVDWPKQLEMVGIGRITLNLMPQRYTLTTSPSWSHPDPPQDVTHEGARMSWEAFFDLLKPHFRREVGNYFFSKEALAGRSVADIPKVFGQEYVVEARSTVLLDADGNEFELVKMLVHVNVQVRFDDVPVQRQLYGSVGVSSGEIDIPETGEKYRVSAIQAQGRPLTKAFVTKLSEDTKGPDRERSS